MIEDVFAGELTNRDKAIGYILLLPSYLFYVPMIMEFLLVMYANKVSNINVYSLNIYLNLAVGGICLLLTSLALKDYIKDNIRFFKEKILEDVIWSFSAGIGILYGLSIASNLLVNALLDGAGEKSSANQQLFETLLSNGTFLMAMQAVIIAPILEELLFRGIIFRTFRGRGKIFAHVISSLLFGFLHVYSGLLQGDMTQWIHMIPYVAMGFAFSYAYEKRGTICVPIIIHMINNFIAVMISLINAKF